MILLLNGAFGIGKSTVARQVSRKLPRSIVLNPEAIGVVLQRAGRMAGRPIDDFQDLALWRRLTVMAVRMARMIWPNVIVPMAFSNTTYLGEIRFGLSRFDGRVIHVCLIAALPVVEARLEARGAHPTTHGWEYRRAAECCAAHAGGEFSLHVRAEREVELIAEDVLATVRRA